MNDVYSYLAQLLSEHYNIQTNAYVLGRSVPLMAQSSLTLQHYAISKKWVLDQANTHDYLLCWQQRTEITDQYLYQHRKWMRKYAESALQSDIHHMRTRVIGVIFTEIESLNSYLKRSIKRSRKFLWLKWGLHGWCELFFIVYHVPSLSWIMPRAGKDFRPLLEELSAKISTD